MTALITLLHARPRRSAGVQRILAVVDDTQPAAVLSVADALQGWAARRQRCGAKEMTQPRSAHQPGHLFDCNQGPKYSPTLPASVSSCPVAVVAVGEAVTLPTAPLHACRETCSIERGVQQNDLALHRRLLTCMAAFARWSSRS